MLLQQGLSFQERSAGEHSVRTATAISPSRNGPEFLLLKQRGAGGASLPCCPGPTARELPLRQGLCQVGDAAPGLLLLKRTGRFRQERAERGLLSARASAGAGGRQLGPGHGDELGAAGEGGWESRPVLGLREPGHPQRREAPSLLAHFLCPPCVFIHHPARPRLPRSTEPGVDTHGQQRSRTTQRWPWCPGLAP